jgi:HEAT repeat protein
MKENGLARGCDPIQMKYAPILLLLGMLASPVLAQTPLQKAFADMKSSDPATAKKAKEGLLILFERELPTIEKDTDTICNALKDPDPSIRLPGAALLSTIVIAAPTHMQVVVACTPQLLTTATDSNKRLRYDSLVALVGSYAETSPQLHEVLVRSLHSPDSDTSAIAAAGLFKENGGTNQANHKLVEDALLSAPDAAHRQALLHATGQCETVGPCGLRSEGLFEASRKFLDDPDPYVQWAAIEAVVVTGTDENKIISALQKLAHSQSASPEVKSYASGWITSLKNRQQLPSKP